MTKVNCIYKYVHNDEIIYIGKSDSSLIARVDGHAKEPKFQPYLKNCKIFYFKTVNPAETKVFETCLIDKYKPILNVIDKYEEGTGRFTVEEPEWKPYRREDFREERKQTVYRRPYLHRKVDTENKVIVSSNKELEEAIFNWIKNLDEPRKKIIAFLLLDYGNKKERYSAKEICKLISIPHTFGVLHDGSLDIILQSIHGAHLWYEHINDDSDYITCVSLTDSLSYYAETDEIRIILSENTFKYTIGKSIGKYKDWASVVLKTVLDE